MWSMRPSPWIRLGACLALASAWAGCARAEGLDQRIPVEPGGLLQVDLDLGEEVRADRVSLDVRSHEADEIYATADLSGLGVSSVLFRVEQDERGVRLYGRSGGLMSWLFGGPGLTVRIWVPRNFSIDARNASGPIRIEDVTGEVRARTTDAALEVRAVEGSLRLYTGGGSVTAAEIRGDVAIRVGTGSVELAWITGDVRARSGGGDIRVRHVEGALELRTDSGEIALRDVRGVTDVRTERGAVYASFSGAPQGRLETQRGSIEVVLPEHAGAALEARSGRGSVEILDGINANGDAAAAHFVGTVNGGGKPLHLYTAHGNVLGGRR